MESLRLFHVRSSHRAIDPFLGWVHVWDLKFGGVDAFQLELANVFFVLSDLLLHVFDSCVQDETFAAALAFHSRHSIGESVESLAYGLTTLLFGGDVIVFLLLFGETRLVFRWGRHDGEGRTEKDKVV